MQIKLVDNYQRRFQYLRLSVTELCNFRCQYCLPDGYQAHQRPSFLSLNEIEQVVSTFSELGVRKIRLTGGEPTLRRDFTKIIELIASNDKIKHIALTTNGSRLYQNIEQWRQAGLTALNVSVDSFSSKMFELITGENKLNEVLKGIDKAIEIGLPTIKVNTVLMRGMNDQLDEYLPWLKEHPVDLRFIELMETKETRESFTQLHISGTVIEQQLMTQGWRLQPKDELAGPAKVYQHPDYLGKVGLIMPYANDFCQNCNRLRISSTGKLHYCLFGDDAIDLRDLLQSSDQHLKLKERILSSLKIKPEKHFLHQHNPGITTNLSIIGG